MLIFKYPDLKHNKQCLIAQKTKKYLNMRHMAIVGWGNVQKATITASKLQKIKRNKRQRVTKTDRVGTLRRNSFGLAIFLVKEPEKTRHRRKAEGRAEPYRELVFGRVSSFRRNEIIGQRNYGE